MANVIVFAGQCLFDIALQECGHVSAAFGVAADNGLAVTDTLTPGTVLVVNAARIVRPEVVSYYRARGHRINTWGTAGSSTAPAGIFDFTFDPTFN